MTQTTKKAAAPFMVLLTALLSMTLAVTLTFPSPALAETSQDEQAGFELEYLTLDCISDMMGESSYSTEGRYILLCNDGTGLFVPANEVYQIADWNTGDGKFVATTTLGDTIEGTIDENYVVSLTWKDEQLEFLALDDGELPLIMNLSPDTWYDSLPYIFDEAGLLSQEQVTELETRAQALSEQYGCDVHLVVVNDMGDYSEWGRMYNIDVFAEEIAQGYNLGHGEDRDLIMLVMSMADRDFSLVSYGPFGKEEVFTSYVRERVVDGFKPSFAENDWYGGFNAYLDAVEKAFVSNEAGIPMSRPSASLHILVSLLFSASIAFSIAYVISAFIRSRHKSVAPQTGARGYMVPNGSQITFSRDTFSYTTESSRYDPLPDNDSSSSSSSYSSGSGFGHTSGKF